MVKIDILCGLQEATKLGVEVSPNPKVKCRVVLPESILNIFRCCKSDCRVY